MDLSITILVNDKKNNFSHFHLPEDRIWAFVAKNVIIPEDPSVHIKSEKDWAIGFADNDKKHHF